MNRYNFVKQDHKAIRERQQLTKQVKKKLKVEYGLKHIQIIDRGGNEIVFLGDSPHGYKIYKYDVAKDEIREPSYVTSEQAEREQARKEASHE